MITLEFYYWIAVASFRLGSLFFDVQRWASAKIREINREVSQ